MRAGKSTRTSWQPASTSNWCGRGTSRRPGIPCTPTRTNSSACCYKGGCGSRWVRSCVRSAPATCGTRRRTCLTAGRSSARRPWSSSTSMGRRVGRSLITSSDCETRAQSCRDRRPSQVTCIDSANPRSRATAPGDAMSVHLADITRVGVVHAEAAHEGLRQAVLALVRRFAGKAQRPGPNPYVNQAPGRETRRHETQVDVARIPHPSPLRRRASMQDDRRPCKVSTRSSRTAPNAPPGRRPRAR